MVSIALVMAVPVVVSYLLLYQDGLLSYEIIALIPVEIGLGIFFYLHYIYLKKVGQRRGRKTPNFLKRIRA